MENKINIAEILKDCPKGMKLYSPIFGKVYLDKIRPHLAIVVTTDKEHGDFKEEFLYDGRYGMNGECMLFPSKYETTWEGFQRPFEDGDIVISNHGDIHINRDNLSSYCCLRRNHFDENITVLVKFDRLATEEEKQKLFDAIKANGYKWNPENKTLEKLIQPKFKVGDTITNGKISIKIGYIDNEYYYELSRNIGYKLFIKNQDEWELISDKFPIKFNIKTLVPFESRVLVRSAYGDLWKPAIFGCYLKDKFYPYYTLGGMFWRYCIPYENNEHLLGKTDDCDDYYKTW